MELFGLINTALLLSGAEVNPFETAAEPIIKLIKMAAGPAIGIVAALGVIYCIFLGVKLAKAEEQQDREKAKGALKNAIVGFLLIFVLIVVLMTGLPAMLEWMNGAAKTSIEVTSFLF